jgi:hypothetical protein
LNRSVQLKRSGSPDVQEQARLRQEILDVSTEADTLLQTMQDHEQLLLDTRRARSDRLFRLRRTSWSAAFIVALALFFFPLSPAQRRVEREGAGRSVLGGRSVVRLLGVAGPGTPEIFPRNCHDSLGQYLVGVKMNLTMLGNSVPPNALIPGVPQAAGPGHDGDPNHLSFIASAVAGRGRLRFRGEMVCGGLLETQRHSDQPGNG